MVNPTADVISEVIALSKTDVKKAKQYLASKLKTGYSQTNRRYNEIVRSNAHNVQFYGKGADAILNISNSSLSTLKEVLSVTEVDTNQWEVDKYSINKQSRTIRENGSHSIVPRFDFRISLKRRAFDFSELHSKFEQLISKRQVEPFKFNPPAENGKLLEICVTDIHYAMLASEKQTRFSDYDLGIAARQHKEAVYGFVERAKAYGVRKIVMPCGGDVYNSDNMAGTTTAGTPQSVSEDSRWQKVFTTVCEVHVQIISKLARDFEVEIVIVNGNHDFERCYYLGEFLRAFFRQHPNVKVNNDPTQRKYHHFGNNLIMWTHGSEERHSDLPLIMATESKDIWSQTTCREIHVGHIHQHKSVENNGVVTRVIPALCPPSVWAVGKGYVGNGKGSEAFLYDKVRGLEAQFYHRW